MSKDIQKDEYLLPGNLGTVRLLGKDGSVTKMEKRNDGSVTLTIDPLRKHLSEKTILYLDESQKYITEDATFEIIEPKQITQ